MLTKTRLIRLCAAREQLGCIGHAERSIDDIAQTAAISRYHFIRQFKAVFGETPVQYRARMRLDRAKHLLVHSEMSITDICMSVGFTSLGSFSTLFTQRFGRSPTQFRQQLRGSSNALSPDCMSLFRAACVSKSQISRSER
ncbi:MAG: helix-turn-helix transcriptional regulator [Pseudomonadota bacterium]